MKHFLSIIIVTFLISCGGGEVLFQGLGYDEDILLASRDPKIIGYDKKEIFTLKGNTTPKVDILLVVDSSESMLSHLQKLGKSLSHLLLVIDNYDWQIAFTTVDHGDVISRRQGKSIKSTQDRWQNNLTDKGFKFGRLMVLDDGKRSTRKTILNKKSWNYETTFYRTLSHNLKIPKRIRCNHAPYCNGPLEQPLRSLKSSIERQRVDNNHFFRPKADLVTLIITNEDERDGDVNATKAQDVIDAFDQTFAGSNKRFINFNILVKDLACKEKEATKNQIANIGSIISELADLTDGENIDICSSNYGGQLAKISKHIKTNLENSLVLSTLPDAENIHIDFGRYKKIPWSLEGKKIKFKGKIPRMTVTVYYN